MNIFPVVYPGTRNLPMWVDMSPGGSPQLCSIPALALSVNSAYQLLYVSMSIRSADLSGISSSGTHSVSLVTPSNSLFTMALPLSGMSPTL